MSGSPFWINRSLCLFAVNSYAMTLLLELFQHCYAVSLVIVDKTAVPVFKCCKQGVTAVMLITLFGFERNIRRQFFKILCVQTFKSLAVKLVPTFKIFKAFTLVFYNQVCVGRAKRIPYFNFFIYVTVISVLYTILDYFTNLLLKKINLFNL